MKKVISIVYAVFTLLGCQAQKNFKLTAADFEAALKKNVQVLDVRTKEEYAQGHIAKALLANWNDDAEFEKRTASLDIKKDVYVYCLSGGRSSSAASNLRKKGYTVYELVGGINAWKKGNFKTEGNATKEAGMTIEAFDNYLNSNELVLVDFGAKWCPPCIKMNPTLDSVVAANPAIKLLKIDLDKDVAICSKYNITELPVFHFYKKAAKVGEGKGIMTFNELMTSFKKLYSWSQ